MPNLYLSHRRVSPHPDWPGGERTKLLSLLNQELIDSEAGDLNPPVHTDSTLLDNLTFTGTENKRQGLLQAY